MLLNSTDDVCHCNIQEWYLYEETTTTHRFTSGDEWHLRFFLLQAASGRKGLRTFGERRFGDGKKSLFLVWFWKHQTKISTRWCPSYVCWFIFTSWKLLRDIYHKSFWIYKPTERKRTGAPHCIVHQMPWDPNFQTVSAWQRGATLLSILPGIRKLLVGSWRILFIEMDWAKC